MPKDTAVERTLRIEIPNCTVAKGVEEETWTNTEAANGWTMLLDIYPVWQGTIDLSGYSRDYKTFYPEGGLIQHGPYYSEVGCSGTNIFTVVSTTPLNPEGLLFQLSTAGGPGFINNGFTAALVDIDQQNWETIMFAQSEMMVTNTNISPNDSGICQVLDIQQSGSLTPTATDTLYVTKIVWSIANFVGSVNCTIPSARVILPGMIGEEPEVEYLMRLKRSVELANQV